MILLSDWTFLGWSFAIILLLAGLLGCWLYLRRGLGKEQVPSKSPSERILSTSGAVCCMETITLLQELSARGDAQEFAKVWMRISIHLESVLPSCPKALRAVLRQHLVQAAQRCSLRSVAKAMNDCAAHC
jgi:hypothetical protein